LSRPERNAESDAQLELACFELHGTCFAVDVAQVREISRCPPLAPLPHAPTLIEGVADLAGSIVPILDLGRVLGREPVPTPERARLLVLESDGLCFGLRIPPAVDVLSFPLSLVEALPALAVEAGYEVVRAVVRRPGESPRLVLSLEALLERVFRCAGTQEEAA
jgi:chemotaxis signal transduction protein